MVLGFHKFDLVLAALAAPCCDNATRNGKKNWDNKTLNLVIMKPLVRTVEGGQTSRMTATRAKSTVLRAVVVTNGALGLPALLRQGVQS